MTTAPPSPRSSAPWHALRGFLAYAGGGGTHRGLDSSSLASAAQAWAGFIDDQAASGHPLPPSELTYGDTWLHRAVRYGHHALAQALVAAGADVNVRNAQGQGDTPLEELLANMLPTTEDDDAFLAFGDGQEVGSFGWRPESLKTMTVLLEAGARIELQPGQDSLLVLSLIQALSDDRVPFWQNALADALVVTARTQPAAWEHRRTAASTAQEATMWPTLEQSKSPHQSLVQRATVHPALAVVLARVTAVFEAEHLASVTAPIATRRSTLSPRL